jgi:hypothetical protein
MVEFAMLINESDARYFMFEVEEVDTIFKGNIGQTLGTPPLLISSKTCSTSIQNLLNRH